jgi:pullulanase/glycogen debranching enzyme
VKRGIVGAIPYSYDIQGFALEPNQTINYIECHDNYTLWDKLCITIGHASEEARRRAHRLASAILLTSQGRPFLHAGQEFMRTKTGIENSYRSNIEINWLDWERRAELDMEVEFMKRCIALRKAHSAFRMRTVDQIRERLVFETCPEGAVAYTLRNHANGDVANHLYVLHHIGLEELQVELPSLGPWKVIFGSREVVSHQGDQLTVRALSSVVLCVD